MTRIERETLRGKVQTVRGPIAPEMLAATLMHEHVLCDITPPSLAALNDPGPEITLENVWAINYGKVIWTGLAWAVGEIRHRDIAPGKPIELRLSTPDEDPSVHLDGQVFVVKYEGR